MSNMTCSSTEYSETSVVSKLVFKSKGKVGFHIKKSKKRITVVNNVRSEIDSTNTKTTKYNIYNH